jgi:hypothetical protein
MIAALSKPRRILERMAFAIDDIVGNRSSTVHRIGGGLLLQNGSSTLA